MLKTPKNNISQILLVALVILGIFGVVGTTSTALAQSAEFQWATTNFGIQVNAQEDGDAFLYNLQLYNQDEEILIDETNNTGNFFIQNSDLTAGEVYDLNLSLLDEESGDIRATHFEPVAAPKLTIEGRCVATLSGDNVEVTVGVVPELDFFPNLSDPEVRIFQNDTLQSMGSELPHEYISGFPERTYRAETTFESDSVLISSDTITLYCDDRDEGEEDVVVNFGYEVDQFSVDAFVISPDEGEYGYGWDIDGDGEIDFGGASLSHTFDTDGSKSISFIVSQDGSDVGSDSADFLLPSTFKDLNGDGTPDHEETEDDVGGGSAAGEDDDDEAEFTGDEQGLVNCTNNCGWAEFIELINKLITWLIGFATVVATLLFMYAGFLYLTAGADENQTKQAIGIFTNVAIGFGVILIAWLIVSAVVTLLTTDEWRNENQPLIPVDLSYELTEDRLQL